MKMKKKQKNNKGFSLIELIVVVAIMAVLVGVLAPTYLRYVEKSRKSADIQAFASAMGAMKVVAADPALELASGQTMTIVFSKETNTDVSFTAPNNTIEKELEATIGKAYRIKSQEWGVGTVSITGTVGSGGTVSFEIQGKDNTISGDIIANAGFGSDVKPKTTP